MLQVNSTLIKLYWNIGKYVSTKAIVEDLAQFIKSKDSNLKGFTARNIWQMKQFYEIYYKTEKLSALLTQMEFYLEALDRDIKTKDEHPSIGILLCRKKNDTVFDDEMKLIDFISESTHKNYSCCLPCIGGIGLGFVFDE